MHVWRSVADVEPDQRSVVTVGNFDGVHRGHAHVVAVARDIAAEQSPPARVVAVTFDPHPMEVLLPERAPVRLTTIDDRGELLLAAGVDRVLVLPFDREVAGWPPEEFVRRILVEALAALVIVVGENFRFGAKAAGDVATLRELGEAAGFRVEVLALDGGAQPWSSTAVRQALTQGDVASAAKILGRLHTVTGVVVEGDHRGRELGYPTANVPTDSMTAVPADGVYAGWLQRLDEPNAPMWPAAISVGTNPTFEGNQRRVESYVLDRDDLELYGVPVEVAFADRLRGQVRFDSVADLVRQMGDDVDQARSLLVEAEDR
ncbi:MAG: bifunctional riboflavin kinase/FAD synthetase [Nocardioidaceae bacterium]|nr:bifunctional riboflavin kinase/FAD synthetase [Nocardioidaceae bacterium]